MGCISPGQLQYCTQSLPGQQDHLHILHLICPVDLAIVCTEQLPKQDSHLTSFSVCIEYEIPVRFSNATYEVTEGEGVTYLRITLEVLEGRTFSFKVGVSTRDGSAEGE